MADDTVTVESTVRPGPALEATSDMPVVETVTPPPENAESNTKAENKTEIAEPVADKTETAEANAGTGAEDTGHEEDATVEATGRDKPEIPPYAKREITKARNRQREAQAAAAAEKTAREAAESRLDLALRSKAESAENAKVVAETPRPKRENFANPDAYDEALIAWSTGVAAKQVEAKVRDAEAKRISDEAKAARDNEARQRQNGRVKAWQEKREAFVKAHPDYEDVAENDDLKISVAMTEALLESDNGPELAYALGKNPELAEKIASLSPAKAALELGKLSASLEAAAKPKVSKTPPPPKPLGSRQNAGKKSADEMSMDEYAAMRTPQIMAERLGPQARQRAN